MNSLEKLVFNKQTSCFTKSALALGFLLLPTITWPQSSVELQIRPSGTQMELRWPGRWMSPAGTNLFPYFEVQQSADLQHWQPIGQKLHGSALATNELSALVEVAGGKAFYRVVGVVPSVTAAGVGAGGDQVFGYAARLADELQRIGQISPEEFASRYAATNTYLPSLTWDPTKATYWNLFSTNASFQPNAQEMALFKTNGFVVSQRLGSTTFADLFYRIYKNDLPVFVSTDAILQAWHRSYDNMLEELEETWLSTSLDKMLTAMAAQVPKTYAEFGSGALHDSILDVDYYLTVARSLLAGTNVSSTLGQDTRVATTLGKVQAAQLEPFDLFGECRTVDFSQFTVRGHYTDSPLLGRYFQAMMWLGRIDFRVAGGPFDDCGGFAFARPRELGSAIVLHSLVTQAGQFDSWTQVDRLLQTFVGWTDSMTVAQLGDLLTAANIKSLQDIPDIATLQTLQTNILQGQLGFQNIRSDWFVSPLGPEQMVLPRSFTFMGQKFVPDSWAFSQFVYDSILWSSGKIMRRIPSALDVAFSVLGNDQIVPELYARMTNTNGRQFRDGLPYQHNLAAVREVIAGQPAQVWGSSIYTSWLDALRGLSAPTTASDYPEAMRTRAWAMKDLNAQLASWTELRHDTILYAKQSYTGLFICMYPQGFVEPRVEFWQRLQDMAQGAATLISQNNYQGTAQVAPAGYGPSPWTFSIDLTTIQTNQVSFLRQFASTMTTLRNISAKELSQQPLSQVESDFLVNLIQSGGTVGSGQQRRYDGWYPQLFYHSVKYGDVVTFHDNAGANKWDALVADVHTDPPDPDVGDPGSVLHEGVGNADLLMIAIDNGPDRMVFAGPVLSHYEFEIIGAPVRKTDPEWKQDYSQGKWPSPPEWTRSYLVPGRPTPSWP